MIKYSDWKKNQINEEDVASSSALDDLVSQTANDIVKSVQDYLDMVGTGSSPKSEPDEEVPAPGPSRSAPSAPAASASAPSAPTSAPAAPAPSAPAPERRGPFERIGRGVDKTGAAIGRGVASLAPDMNKTYKPTPAEKAAGSGDAISRRDRLASRHPVLFGKSDNPDAPWYSRIWDRLKKSFNWMKKMKSEGRRFSIDSVLTVEDIQSMLREGGAHPFFLVEANADFGKLTNVIKAHLQAFADGVQKHLSGPKADAPASPPDNPPSEGPPMPQPDPSDVSPRRPEPGDNATADPSSMGSPEPAAPEMAAPPEAKKGRAKGTKKEVKPKKWNANKLVEAGKAHARKKAGHLNHWLGAIGLDVSQMGKLPASQATTVALETMLLKLGFSQTRTRLLAREIKKTGNFPDSVIEALKGKGKEV